MVVRTLHIIEGHGLICQSGLSGILFTRKGFRHPRWDRVRRKKPECKWQRIQRPPGCCNEPTRLFRVTTALARPDLQHGPCHVGRALPRLVPA